MVIAIIFWMSKQTHEISNKRSEISAIASWFFVFLTQIYNLTFVRDMQQMIIVFRVVVASIQIEEENITRNTNNDTSNGGETTRKRTVRFENDDGNIESDKTSLVDNLLSEISSTV